MPFTSSQFKEPWPIHPPTSEIDTAMEDSGSFRCDKTDPGGRLAVSHTFGHYELLEIIGEGKFGTVWRAKDQQLERIVALKLPHLVDLDEQSRTMFLREARAAATLEHPHIVRVHGVVQEGSQLGIVSQFIVGQTLSELLEERKLTFSKAAQLLATISEAVHYAHNSEVIHRDLKPSNILVDSAGQPHVSDFGLAKWSGEQATQTNPGLVMGTPAYMSPEQARGDSHAVDRRSDVYSLGVLLYEMLTGRTPFEGNSTLLLHQIQRQEPRTPRSLNEAVPKDLETICLKCLAKAPDERYGTAHELADDLRRFLAGEPIAARFVSLTERCVRWARRNSILAASLAVAAASTLAAIGLSFSVISPARSEVLAPVADRILAVSVVTDPPGAKIVVHPLDELTGEPVVAQAQRPSMTSPLTVNLLPGDYLVVAALDDGRFHEVFRHVPRNPHTTPDYYPHRSWEVDSNEAISWFPIKIPEREQKDMALFADTESDLLLSPFLLDQHEITVRDFLREFHDQLPLSLRGSSELLQTPDLPLTGLFFDEAVLYAEMVGKRLPTALEYEFAATNGWKTRYPWGDTAPPAESWRLTRVGANEFDRTRSDPPVHGLFSNAAEFVLKRQPLNVQLPSGGVMLTEDHPTQITVCGGPVLANTDTDQFPNDPRTETAIARRSLFRQVGFRCAKSKSPRI